jgi:hypothetical protein
MFVPSQFRLVFRGTPDAVLLAGGFQLAVPVTIGQMSIEGPSPLITGEVTAVEVEYAHGETMTIIRGMDMSNRLMHGNKTMAYPEMTASDVVAILLGESGVIPGEIIPTETIYPWLTQANVSSWVFIQQMAALEGYVAYSDPLGLFNFCPMPLAEEAGPPAMTYAEPMLFNQLVMGRNLIRLRAVVTSAEQVPAVTVTGWDSDMGMPVIGPFPAVPSTAASLDPAVEPAVVAGEFAATPFFDASRVFDNEGAAMKWAESVATDIAGALAEIEGECLGNPKLLAGIPVTLGMAGLPFDGNYVVSAARHVFDPSDGGYTTWVTVGGYRDRSLYALSSGAGVTDKPSPTMTGLVIGTVVDNADPLEHGQVKVMFPWLAPDYISAWARVMQIGASKAGSGFLWLPEIGDEVLVGFDRGSIEHPFVIGNLYGGVAMPIPPPSVEGVVGNRRIASRMGHTIQWNDGPDALGISIATAPAEEPAAAPTSIVLNGEDVSITINSLGQVSINGALGITIGGPECAKVSISAAEISIGSPETAAVSMAGAAVSIGGGETATVSITADGEASVSAAMVTLGGG